MTNRLLCLLACAAAPVGAQHYVISTYAGGAPASRPATAVNTGIGTPTGLAVDAEGNVFIGGGLNCIFRLDRNGLMTRIAGDLFEGYSGDGGPAIAARLDTDDGEPGWPSGLTLDTRGNLYLADIYNHRVRRISPEGKITTVAGNGKEGSSGDGGLALEARLAYPSSLAVDSTGNVYIADPANARVRRVSPDGLITTAVGRGTQGFSGDGGPASNAELRNPLSIAIDTAGNLYVADVGNSRIRRVSSDGVITTLPGSVPDGYTGDPQADAQLERAIAVAADKSGNLIVATSNRRIRKIFSDGTAVTLAGDGGLGFAGDHGPAAQARFSYLSTLAVDDAGNIYLSDAWNNQRVRKISTDGIITTVAGNGASYFGGDGGPVDLAQVNISCCQGGGGMVFDRDGRLYFADSRNSRIRAVSPDGIISTVAGNGGWGYTGDGGPATETALGVPFAVAPGPNGEFFIADTYNFRVRSVSREGVMTTVAGTGTAGHSGDGGPAPSAQIGHVFGMTIDAAGNLYLAELQYIRKISPDGIITTLAGPGGPLGQPFGTVVALAAAGDGSLYIADEATDRILKLTSDGALTTFAGTGMRGYSGDGGPALQAQFAVPWALALDAGGNLYVADWGNRRIRKISSSGIVTTIAGSGAAGYPWDAFGPALDALIGPPTAVTVDTAGNVFFADGYMIRELRPLTGASN